MNRIAQIDRETTETKVRLILNLDGAGKASIKTNVPFLTHMLELFTKHGLFDLTVDATGDVHIDAHHTVEDIGICLGQAFREAIGDAAGICRYASGLIPMDEALCQLAVDVSNRAYLGFNVDFPKASVGNFDVELVEEFLSAFVSNARVSLHVSMISGQNLHHIIEAIFKALGVVLDKATQKDPRKTGIPSTKGIL